MSTADSVSGLSKIRVRQNSMVGEVLSRLLNFLVSSDIRPGDKLPSERSLSEHLGLGRSAVREAVKSLHLLGIVDVRQGDGTYLRGTQSDVLPQILEWGLILGQPTTHDLVEAREYIEVFVARRAAERITPDGAARLDACIARMEAAGAAGRGEDFVEADVEFHLLVADMAGNSVFVDVLRSIRTLLHVWISRIVASGGLGDSIEQHRRVADAIKAGDAEGAHKAMHAHITSAGTRLLASLPDENKLA